MAELVKLVVFVPVTHADQVRSALGDAGAGGIGNYTHCSFSVRGIGRFRPIAGANPFLGRIGELEEVEEERVEVIVERSRIRETIAAMRRAHPYEEPAFEVYPLLEVE
jgi:hypothetical protein